MLGLGKVPAVSLLSPLRSYSMRPVDPDPRESLSQPRPRRGAHVGCPRSLSICFFPPDSRWEGGQLAQCPESEGAGRDAAKAATVSSRDSGQGGFK